MIRLFPLLVLVLLQAACVHMAGESSTSRRIELPPERPSAEMQAPRRVEPAPSPRARTPSRAESAAKAEPAAVVALMQEADRSSGSGQYDKAAATLERAIRIQPRNARLWQQLAYVRLQQHQPVLAENLAKKSSVLAQGDRDLIRKNWAIIAESRRQKGDAEGASEADARAGQ